MGGMVATTRRRPVSPTAARSNTIRRPGVAAAECHRASRGGGALHPAHQASSATVPCSATGSSPPRSSRGVCAASATARPQAAGAAELLAMTRSLGRLRHAGPRALPGSTPPDPPWSISRRTLCHVRDRVAQLCRHRGLKLSHLDLHVVTADRLCLETERDRVALDQTAARLRPALLLLGPP